MSAKGVEGNLEKQQLEGVRFKAGEVLFHEGETSFHFFVIQKGQVEIFKTAPNGDEIPIAVVDEGHSIGEFALLDKQPRSATARAFTEVKAVKIDEAAYSAILDELPEWARTMLTNLAERLRKANGIISQLDAENRQFHKNIEAMEFTSPTSPGISTRVK